MGHEAHVDDILNAVLLQFPIQLGLLESRWKFLDDDCLAFDRRYAGAAHYVVAELCRLRGRVGEADRFYARSHELGATGAKLGPTGHPVDCRGRPNRIPCI